MFTDFPEAKKIFACSPHVLSQPCLRFPPGAWAEGADADQTGTVNPGFTILNNATDLTHWALGGMSASESRSTRLTAQRNATEARARTGRVLERAGRPCIGTRNWRRHLNLRSFESNYALRTLAFEGKICAGVGK